jgi:hypothetical protein
MKTEQARERTLQVGMTMGQMVQTMSKPAQKQQQLEKMQLQRQKKKSRALLQMKVAPPMMRADWMRREQALV